MGSGLSTVAGTVLGIVSQLRGVYDQVGILGEASDFPLILSFFISLSFIFLGVRGNAREISCSLLYCASSVVVLLSSNLTFATIGFEVMALSAASLVALGNHKERDSAFFCYTCVHFFSGTLLLLGACQHESLGHLEGLPRWLFIMGLLINAAAFPSSFWVMCSYPRASGFGIMVLSLFTTKVALSFLLRMFSGEPTIMYVGILTAVYAVVLSLIEKNVRRLMSYGLVGQVGLVLIAIGCEGIPRGVIVAQMAFSVLYQLLLFMVADHAEQVSGSVDINKMSGSVGLFSIESFGCLVALLNMSSFPGTAGFVAKGFMLHMGVESLNYELLKYVHPVLGLALFASVGMKFFWQTTMKRGACYSNGKGSIASKVSILSLSLVVVVLGVLYGQGVIFHSHKFVYTSGEVSTKLAAIAMVLFCFALLRNKFVGRVELSVVESWVHGKFVFVAEKLGGCFSFIKGLVCGYAFEDSSLGIEIGDRDTTLLSDAPTGLISSTILLVMLCICIVLVWAYV